MLTEHFQTEPKAKEFLIKLKSHGREIGKKGRAKWSFRWLGPLQSFTALNTNVTPGTRWKMALGCYIEEILPSICHKKSLTNNLESSSVLEVAPIFVLAV